MNFLKEAIQEVVDSLIEMIAYYLDSGE